MSKLTKRQKTVGDKIDSNKLYALPDALGLVKEFAVAKFDESIDVAVQLGIDAKKSDQVVRGAVVLPNGTGKPSALQYLPKAPRLKKPKPPVPTLWAWTIWLPTSKRARWISTW